MIRKTSFLLDDVVHDRLKALAKTHGLTLGGMIRRTIDSFEGRPNVASPEYKRWLQAVIRIGNVGGDEAAQRFIDSNPPPL